MSKHSTVQVPFSIHSVSGSKPIHIASKGKVVIILPPRVQPPPMASPPSHRTAPNPQPVLLSSSYPGRHHQGSPPTSSAMPQMSGLPETRARTSPRSSLKSHPQSTSPPTGSSNLSTSGSSGPMNRSVSHDSYTRSTITPVVRSSASSRRSMLEDEYYSHPAVRAYEMQKAAEQARWTRNRMAQKRAAAAAAAVANSQSASARPPPVFYGHVSMPVPQQQQQRW